MKKAAVIFSLFSGLMGGPAAHAERFDYREFQRDVACGRAVAIVQGRIAAMFGQAAFLAFRSLTTQVSAQHKIGIPTVDSDDLTAYTAIEIDLTRKLFALTGDVRSILPLRNPYRGPRKLYPDFLRWQLRFAESARNHFVDPEPLMKFQAMRPVGKVWRNLLENEPWAVVLPGKRTVSTLNPGALQIELAFHDVERPLPLPLLFAYHVYFIENLQKIIIHREALERYLSVHSTNLPWFRRRPIEYLTTLASRNALRRATYSYPPLLVEAPMFQNKGADRLHEKMYGDPKSPVLPADLDIDRMILNSR